MKLSNHKNFLQSKEHYNDAKIFWRNYFDEINPNYREYILNQYANGEEIIDGNPIFSALYNNSLGIRLILNPVTLHEPIFVSWVSKTIVGNVKVKELVIMTQPLNYLLDDLEFIVRTFLGEASIKKIQQHINEKYNDKWLFLMSKRIISKTGQIASLDITNPDLDINESTLKDFVQIVAIENNYIDVPSWQIRSPLSEAFKRVSNSVKNISEVVTIRGDYTFRSVPSLPKYKRKIKKGFSSPKIFKKKVGRNLIQLNNDIKDLKKKVENVDKIISKR